MVSLWIIQALLVKFYDKIRPKKHIALQLDSLEKEAASKVRISSSLILCRLHHLNLEVLILFVPYDCFSGSLGPLLLLFVIILSFTVLLLLFLLGLCSVIS